MSRVQTEEKGIIASLDDYWFGHGSPTSFGLFRIFMGLLIFINQLMIATDWGDWFSEQGYVPAWLGQLWLGPNVGVGFGTEWFVPRIGLINGVTNPTLTVLFYGITTFAALTTALGLWSRTSTIILALGVVSLQHRNAAILHGGDTVMRVCALYLALGPSGAACSLDRLIRIWKGKETGEPIRVSLWAQRLVCYNMALIYLTTMWLKRFGSLWMDGSATWYPARLAEFYRFPVPPFLNDFPMVKVTTYGTLLVEFALGTLVFFRPLRKYVLLSGIMMHLYIDYSMNIPLFSYLMMSMYVCFYDGEEVRGWATRVGARLKRFHTTVLLPAAQRLNPRGVAFFEAADPFNLVTYTPGEAAELTNRDVRKSWTHSVGSWIFAWIPGLWRKLLTQALEPLPDPETEQASRRKAKR